MWNHLSMSPVDTILWGRIWYDPIRSDMIQIRFDNNFIIIIDLHYYYTDMIISDPIL